MKYKICRDFLETFSVYLLTATNLCFTERLVDRQIEELTNSPSAVRDFIVKLNIKYPPKFIENSVDVDEVNQITDDDDECEIVQKTEECNTSMNGPNADTPMSTPKLKDIQNHTSGTFKQSKISAFFKSFVPERVHKENCMPALSSSPNTNSENSQFRKTFLEDSDYESSSSTGKRPLEDYDTDCRPKRKLSRLSEMKQEYEEDLKSVSSMSKEPAPSTSMNYDESIHITPKKIRQSTSSKTEEDSYEVESIIEYNILQNKISFKVKWLGYPLSQSTWEPLANIRYCSQFDEFLLKEYDAKKGILLAFQKSFMELLKEDIKNFFAKNKKVGISKALELFDEVAFKCDLMLSFILQNKDGNKLFHQV